MVGNTSWNHCFVVLDTGFGATEPRIYINGQMQPIQADAPPGIVVAVNTSSSPMDVGAQLTEAAQFTGTESQYTGDLDEIAIWLSRPGAISSLIDYDSMALEVFGGGLSINLNNILNQTAGADPTRWWRFETPAVLQGQRFSNGHIGLENSGTGGSGLDLWLPPARGGEPTYIDGPQTV
jgi:hypothetical protein